MIAIEIVAIVYIVLLVIFVRKGWTIREDQETVSPLGGIMALLFIPVAVIVIGGWFRASDKDEYIYEHVDTIEVQYSKGGSVNYFYEYEGKAYPTKVSVEDSIWVYKGKFNPSFFYSFFSPSEDTYFSNGEDKFLQASQGADIKQEQ